MGIGKPRRRGSEMGVKEKKITITCEEGVCINCGSQDVSYRDAHGDPLDEHLELQFLVRTFQCNECGSLGRDYYIPELYVKTVGVKKEDK
jgi:hypothetical protein